MQRQENDHKNHNRVEPLPQGKQNAASRDNGEERAQAKLWRAQERRADKLDFWSATIPIRSNAFW